MGTTEERCNRVAIDLRAIMIKELEELKIAIEEHSACEEWGGNTDLIIQPLTDKIKEIREGRE